MFKSISLILVLFCVALAVEGNYSDGFYVRGLVQCYYQNTVCNPPFGCSSDSPSVRAYDPTHAGFSDVSIYTQVYSTNSTINGKIMDFTVPKILATINSDGTYKMWIDVASYATLQHSYYARLETIVCNTVGLHTELLHYGAEKFDTTKNVVNDIRVWAITFGADDNLKVDKYASKLKVNGKYSDIVVNYITGYGMDYYDNQCVVCSGLTPTGPVSTTNPLVHNVGNSSQTRNFIPTMLNGRVVSRTNYLTKWNHIVSQKRP